MDILIIGAGAVGSLLAFRLGAAGNRVTAVGRAPFVQAVHCRGLLLEADGHARPALNVQAVEGTDVLQDARYDLVVITTKAFDTAVAAVQAQPFVQRGAAVMTVQNGVGGDEIAQGILGDRNLYAAVITIPVEAPKPAVIRVRSEKGGMAIAAVAREDNPSFLVDLISRAGFRACAHADWRAIKWSKLMLNILGNAIPAILDWPLEQVYATRRLFELELGALREAYAVIHKLGVRLSTLPGYPVPLWIGALCALPSWLTHPVFKRVVMRGRGGKRPSLYMDLARGRDNSEVEFLNGAVVKAGARLGVPTPVNHALCDVLSNIVRGRVAWSEYRGQADRLIGQVQE